MIRIVAMLLVVALHCMDYGGFIKLSEANLFLSLFVSLNHTISICAVNCFALISGYLGTVKYYAQIHLQVWQNSVCTGQGNLPLIT